MTRSSLLLTAAILLSATGAYAQDKATLDLLVKKGIITQAEANETLSAAKPAPIKTAVTAKDPNAVEKVTMSGLIQGRYSFISQNEKGAGLTDPHDVSAFSVRRAIITIEADFGQGWGAFIAPEMDGVPAGGNTTAQNTAQFYLDRAGVQYTCAAGTAVAGLRKVNFGLEEYGAAATALVVERSAASTFSATNNFASRHTGLYWDGKVKDSGLFYGAAVTNSQVNVNFPTTTISELAFWSNVGYDFICPLTNAKAKVGLNLGYIAETGTLAPNPVTSLDGYALGSAFGYNPYLTLTNGKTSFTAEVLGWETDGIKGNPDVSTLGYNLTAAYKVTDTIEPVVRFSHIRTGELGMTDLAAVTGATGTRDYTEITSLYGGVNYYIRGNNLKVQAGYEVSQLSDSIIPGSQIDAHALRVQIQAMF